MLSIGQINEGCGVNLSSDFSLPSVFLKSKGTADDKVRQFSLNSKKKMNHQALQVMVMVM